MTVAQSRSRSASRVSALTGFAVLALALGASSLAVGLSTWGGLLLAASAVTLDILILQFLASRRFVIAGTVFGIVLLVGLLVLATSLVGGI